MMVYEIAWYFQSGRERPALQTFKKYHFTGTLGITFKELYGRHRSGQNVKWQVSGPLESTFKKPYHRHRSAKKVKMTGFCSNFTHPMIKTMLVDMALEYTNQQLTDPWPLFWPQKRHYFDPNKAPDMARPNIAISSIQNFWFLNRTRLTGRWHCKNPKIVISSA